MSTTFARNQTPTFGSNFQACMYSVFVSTLVVFCVCTNYFFITVGSDSIVRPLKKSTYLNAEDHDDLYLFDEKELSLYNGVENPEIYLSIIGHVFDVTEGKKHYGAGCTYNIFVGRDNSRAFITGKFEIEDISDDILTLPPVDVIGIQNWLNLYKKSYTRKGKLIGRYYDVAGKLTPYGREVKKVLKQSEKELAKKAATKHRFPECNVEWDPKKGSKFWCTNQSGGIKRNWVGIPKQIFLPGSEARCACIQETEVNTLENIKSYDHCQADEKVCFVQPNENTKQVDSDVLQSEESNNRNEL